VIRQAYFEDPAYVPLLLRAYELWRELEAATGEALMTITGGMMIGSERSEVVQGSLRSAREHGLPHELLGSDEVRRRFPPFAVSDQVALFEPNAGFVRPEKAVRAHLDLARSAGADLRFGTRVLGFEAGDKGVSVFTSDERVEADRVVFTAGSWTAELLGKPLACLRPERQVLYWFEPKDGRLEPFRQERFPVFIWEDATGDALYGLPTMDGEADSGPGGVKVAFYRRPDLADPHHVDREVKAAEVAAMRAALAKTLPGLNGQLLGSRVCLYTMAPDQHFVLGMLSERLVVASPCSGHGFKFAPVMGEVLADLAMTGSTSHSIERFGLDRILLASLEAL
jgi:sarcosine oxidase